MTINELESVVGYTKLTLTIGSLWHYRTVFRSVWWDFFFRWYTSPAVGGAATVTNSLTKIFVRLKTMFTIEMAIRATSAYEPRMTQLVHGHRRYSLDPHGEKPSVRKNWRMRRGRC